MSNQAEVAAHLDVYVKLVAHIYHEGNATEHSYRPALQALLQAIAPGITATNEAKREKCGAPDFTLTRRETSGPRTFGYVETKDIGVPLDEVLRTDQLKRYRTSLDNLILTDYLEFRWFVNGEQRLASARIASVGPDRKLRRDPEGMTKVAGMLVAMLGQKAPAITSPKDLAERMARTAHMVRDIAIATLHSDEPETRTARQELSDLHEAFKKTLLPDLSEEDFADMFAQTLAYGLFAARYNHSGPSASFTRHDATREIPRSNPFLRRLFATIESSELDSAPYVGFVDDLAQLLAETDMAAVLRDFGKRTRTEDAIVHFYETFLAAYDPKLRELRGVYYTPEPVVSYIVRSVDALLKREFGLSEGLANDRLSSDPARDHQPVTILDPACGTGTFLYYVVSHIRERFRAANNAGAWPGYVRDRLLPRLFGFELLMAPYAMAHLKLGMQLAALDLPEADRERWAFVPEEGERLGIYLTNTLEQAAKTSERLVMAHYITEEANTATEVKRDKPVMVVLGNPPYSGHSANNSDWIMALLRGEDLTNTQGETLRERGKGVRTHSYFMVDGEPLGERNPKWLNDDYVKFIRFAQWRIERSGYGVLAFVTNHGYLDNPTFRGMRQSLMRTFDEIYVLDLHGNSKKKERTPEGGKDENVFDIQQGVAIGIFIRRRGAPTGDRQAIVRHAHLYGERAYKYDWLAEHDVECTEWTEVAPASPMYFFVPRDARLSEEYEQGWALPAAMPVNVLGFQTHRDHFAIDFDEKALRARITEMRGETTSDATFADKYELTESDGWRVATARRQLRADANWQSQFLTCLYRPFDWRSCYFSEVAMDRPRRELRQHMLQPNLSLSVTRQTKADFWRNAVVANTPTPALYTEIKDGANVFPLYLYPDPAKPGLWGESEPSTAPGGRRPNLAPDFIADFGGRLGMAWVPDGKGDRERTFGPEDVFSYIYAVLHSPTYRERYADFLKSDFPRIPLTRDPALFRALCALGDRLTGDHLLERELPAIVSYPVRGGNRVEAVRYLEPDPAQGRKGRVYINAEQYFEGVEPAVWEFHIGGYQVAEKWLKDRKGRTLSYDDIEHYEKTIAALADTAALMEQVDAAIEEHGGWPLDGAAD
jgi:predicted helicase